MKYALMIVALLLCIGMVSVADAQCPNDECPALNIQAPEVPAPYLIPRLNPPVAPRIIRPRGPIAPPVWRPYARLRWFKFNYKR